MNTFDYLIDSALVLLVLMQIRERPLSQRTLIRPLVILAIAIAGYLHGIPAGGDDLELLLVFLVIGGAIGLASGVTVIMRRSVDGVITLRAGGWSAFFWVLGMGSRFAFVYWITHTGVADIARFSARHQITSSEAWTVALLGMAVAEVLLRTGVIAGRWRSLQTAPAIGLAA